MEPLRSRDLGDLVARMREGDDEAWTVLTDRYASLLWSVARSMRLSEADAADAVQTTWLRLVEALDGCATRRGSAPGWPPRCGGSAWRCCGAARGSVGPGRPDGWDQLAGDTAALDEALLRASGTPRCGGRSRGSGRAASRLLRMLMADPRPATRRSAAALDMPVGGIGPTRRRCLDNLRKIMLTGAHPSRPRPDRSDGHGA